MNVEVGQTVTLAGNFATWQAKRYAAKPENQPVVLAIEPPYARVRFPDGSEGLHVLAGLAPVEAAP